MMPNRTKLLVTLGMLVTLWAIPAAAQDLQGMQIFAPADVSPYGGAASRANLGYFFSFDGLYWSISTPKTSYIGLPPTDPEGTRVAYWDDDISGFQISGLTTGSFEASFNPGTRVEFGRVAEDNHGWLFSTFRVHKQTQDPEYFNGVPIIFRDPLGLMNGVVDVGPPPVIRALPMTFEHVAISNEVETWNVEFNLLRRTPQFHRGGYLEFFLGPRYMEVNEDFNVIAEGGPMADSRWFTRAENHMIGGQLGLRYFKKSFRWMLNLEGRFFAGLNRQNFKQEAVLGSQLINNRGTVNYPNAWEGSASTTFLSKDEWCPGVELRAELRYQLARSLSLRAGWTGMWFDGIARASNVVRYELPNMGIDASDNRQGLFIHGVTVGVDINR
jgi:hypothetical protein